MWQPRTVNSNDNSQFMEKINDSFAGIATDPLYDPTQIADIVNKHTVAIMLQYAIKC